MEENENDEKESTSNNLPILLVLLVISAWGLTWYHLKDNPTRGTFGDMFGSINALFSGLAFVGVIYAIILQSKELKLQRQELRDTREELQGQKLQMQAQNATLKKQNFENTFFELLRIQNDITNSIDLVDFSNKITKGRDCFEVFYKRFKMSWGRNMEIHKGNKELDRINNTYLDFYKSHQSEFGHYFRNMYNIVKFVDNSEIRDKKFYTNLIRSQLSSFELALFFYNSLTDLGSKKFKPLIEKYALLKNISKELILEPTVHMKLYEMQAYEKFEPPKG